MSASKPESSLRDFGRSVQAVRRAKRLTQDELARRIGTSRTTIALLEQGRRSPDPATITAVTTELGLPAPTAFAPLDEQTSRLVDFEIALAELVGGDVSLGDIGGSTVELALECVGHLFTDDCKSDDHAFSTFNSALVFYRIPHVSRSFFTTFLTAQAFRSTDAFAVAVRGYQARAIRLFSTFAEAFDVLSRSDNVTVQLRPLEKHDLKSYQDRRQWTGITPIPTDRLPDLGYISAARVQLEAAERQSLSTFLSDIAKRIRAGEPRALATTPEQTLRRMDTLLRKFDTQLAHGVMSPLFAPDADALEREAIRLAPRADQELARMAHTQSIAEKNLASYLTSDAIDVYVATSMRSDADYVSVTGFVTELFAHPDLHALNLRYFNPTQSWVEDRVAKGLVEALMLRRAAVCVYMAQKDDTFGKDSEASVALGQGKPVLVYVPKLLVPEVDVDTDVLGRKTPEELRGLANVQRGAHDSDLDREALLAHLVTERLRGAPGDALARAVARCWADFDLYSEASRIDDAHARQLFRSFLDDVRRGSSESPADLREGLISVLVAVAMRFERRATIFRAVHPLALQVILSSGVLNGILVVRSVSQSAKLLRALIENDLETEFHVDELNYRLVESVSGSTLRVISRHPLLQSAFSEFYSRGIRA